MIYVFLAEGFEEVEALAPVDLLRRAKKEVQTVGVTGKVVTSSHGVPVTADLTQEELSLNGNVEMIVLPGGMPGTLNEEASEVVQNAIAFVQQMIAILVQFVRHLPFWDILACCKERLRFAILALKRI